MTQPDDYLDPKVTPPTTEQRWQFERRQLLAEIERLQKELAFWKPKPDMHIYIGPTETRFSKEPFCPRCGKPIGGNKLSLCEACTVAMGFVPESKR